MIKKAAPRKRVGPVRPSERLEAGDVEVKVEGLSADGALLQRLNRFLLERHGSGSSGRFRRLLVAIAVNNLKVRPNVKKCFWKVTSGADFAW